MNGPIADRRRGVAWAVTLALLTFAIATAWAQAPVTVRAEGRAERLEEMASLLRDIRVTEPAHPGRGPLPLRPEPLHRWTDPTRELSDGGLWAFGKSGRPVALATMEMYGRDPKASSVWSCELISLAPGPLAAEAGGKFFIPSDRNLPGLAIPLKWAPKKPGIAFEAFPEAPAPAATEAERLRQMKTLSERFSAYQEGNRPDGSRPRFELRLLPRPAHRYADPAAGLVDGAIFLLVYGTNPELLLFVEARKPAERDRPAAWSFGCARLSTAALSVSLDGRESWTRPHAQEPDPEETYYFVLTARPTKE